MNLIKLAAQIILIYVLYRLVVNFVIPVFRSVSKFRKDFLRMQQGMNQQYEQQQKFSRPQNQTGAPKEKSVVSNEGEYIEFEEIKQK